MEKQKMPNSVNSPLLNDEEIQKFAESKEIKDFYHVLAVAHSNAILRVLQSGSLEGILAQAKHETDRITKEENLLSKCGDGTIWDATLQQCVPLRTIPD
jgi:hypothetical protein